MKYYPVLLQLEEKTILVVGGGSVAERKVENLLEFGCRILIVSRELTKKLHQLIEIKRIQHLGSEFKEEQLEGVFLVIAATNDKDLNSRISAQARNHRLLVNAVDQPADCDFIFPSILRRGDLLIAISTSGKSPALAKSVRKKLETQFGREYGVFLDLMGRLRKKIMSEGFSQNENSLIFHKIVDSDILNCVARDDWEGVKSILRAILPSSWEVAEIVEELSQDQNNATSHG